MTESCEAKRNRRLYVEWECQQPGQDLVGSPMHIHSHERKMPAEGRSNDRISYNLLSITKAIRLPYSGTCSCWIKINPSTFRSACNYIIHSVFIRRFVDTSSTTREYYRCVCFIRRVQQVPTLNCHKVLAFRCSFKRFKKQRRRKR
jgi:hypothetical protein